jgi:catechol 2,3-dioxygenase-like lactoylglutathione lyase family enzyme
MSLTVLTIVDNQDRSRDFYHNVMGAEIVRDRRSSNPQVPQQHDRL